MDAMNNFYINIEAERVRNNMTISECAEKLGIAEKTYRNRRDERSDIKFVEAAKYAQLFDCSLDYLLGRTDKIRVSK